LSLATISEGARVAAAQPLHRRGGVGLTALTDSWRLRPHLGRSPRCIDLRRGTATIDGMRTLPPPRRIGFLATAAVPLAALAIGGCGGSSTQAVPVPPKTASGQTATVGLEPDSSLGKVLVDSRGRTLYLFRKDSRGSSACSAACATAWPPLRISGRPLAGPGLTPSKLATIRRPDGTPQVVYNGHPLYRYSGDAKRGDANGQGLTAFGAPWFAVSGVGNVVSRPAANPSGGGGGGAY
jgi:predicted lipoprotein with Yx(FWY)xxD motif